MEVEFMLVAKCDECKTLFVPDYIKHGPIDVDPQSDGGRGRIMTVRFLPRCPACTAVGNMLRRAGLNKLATEF